MKRRKFISLIGATAVALPLAARAQPLRKVYRVALIFPNPPLADMTGPEPPSPYVRVFQQALRDLGYVEGSNLVLERRSAEGNYERYAEIGAELVQAKMDVIVAANNRGIELLKLVTNSVPIVMAGVLNPVEAGLVASLARPGGNITGFTFDQGPEIETVRLQLLREAVPSADLISFLGTKHEWEILEQTLQTAARRLRVELSPIELVPSRYAEVLPSIAQASGRAILASRNGSHVVNSRIIADFLRAQRLPSMFYWREIAEVGGLMSYSADYKDILRKAAGYVDRILKGANPADMPVQQPTKFELVINSKTAKALGLTIPPSLLVAADEVIE